ncbi:MAG: DUF177 domain-containing protein [Bdellovibrionaceae bacterium]|nr:DUF177 domain-containing protein [Pseudobdellovibrionaceae bacterium]
MNVRKNSEIIINLNEIHPDGEPFQFNRKSGELNKILHNIIGDGDYNIEFTITPVGDVFELKGHFFADKPLICSRCAFDFQSQLKEDFHEILVVSEELPRKGHLSRPNHSSEGFLHDGPFFNELRSPHFSISNFAHEIMALAEPLNPLGKENCDENCENYLKALKEGWLKKEEALSPSRNAFSILEQLKSDSIKNT